MSPTLVRDWLEGIAACESSVRLASRVTGGGVCILMLHELHADGACGARQPPRRSLSVAALEASLRLIVRTHAVIGLDDALDMLAGRAPWRKRCVVLTFDDSMKSAVSLAAPLLCRMGLTATFYISTDAIDRQQPYWWVRLEYAATAARDRCACVSLTEGRSYRLAGPDAAGAVATLRSALWSVSAAEREDAIAAVESQLGARLSDGADADPLSRLLTWADVRQLQAMGMTVGSHTVTHPDLSRCRPEEMRFELEESRRRIEAELGIACRHFCYPGGRFDAETVRAVRAYGYVSAVTTRAGMNNRSCDPYLLKRWGMPKTARGAVRVVSGVSHVLSSVRLRFSAAVAGTSVLCNP